MSVVEVTSGAAVEIRFTLSDCYFESNNSEKGGDVLAACCAKHPPPQQVRSMTMGRPLLVKRRYYKQELNL